MSGCHIMEIMNINININIQNEHQVYLNCFIFLSLLTIILALHVLPTDINVENLDSDDTTEGEYLLFPSTYQTPFFWEGVWGFELRDYTLSHSTSPFL
jgi:hypothetical protein